MGAAGAGIIFAVLSIEASGGWELTLIIGALIIAVLGIISEFA